MKLKFVCSKCGKKAVEEVMTGVIQYSRVSAVDKDSGGLDYDGNNCEGGEIVAYQCMGCGEHLVDEFGGEITDGEGLVEWLKAHQPKRKTKKS